MQRELLKFKNMDIKESKEYRLAVTMTGTGHRTRKRSISWNTSMNTEKMYH